MGHVISDDDLTLYILNGLSSEYETISATFRSRETSIPFEEIYEKLLEHASYKKRLNPEFEEPLITAHAATRFLHPNSPRVSKDSPHHTRAYGSDMNHSKRFASSSSMPQTRSLPHTSNYKGRCQLCSTQGHSAMFCSLLR